MVPSLLLTYVHMAALKKGNQIKNLSFCQGTDKLCNNSLATEGTGWNSPTNILTRKFLFVMQWYDTKSPLTNCIMQLNISDKLLSKLPSKLINNLSFCLESETVIWSFCHGANLNSLAISTNFKDRAVLYRLQNKS